MSTCDGCAPIAACQQEILLSEVSNGTDYLVGRTWHIADIKNMTKPADLDVL